MSQEPLHTLASFRVKPDQIEAFKSLMRSVREATQAEPGCISYALQQSVQEPSLFVFVEVWRAEADLADHLKTPHIQAIADRLQMMLICAPQVDFYKTIS